MMKKTQEMLTVTMMKRSHQPSCYYLGLPPQLPLVPQLHLLHAHSTNQLLGTL
jgi:hypothetical protein